MHRSTRDRQGDDVKVHELARELGLTSKDLIAKLESMNIPVRNHMSALDDQLVERVRKALADGAELSAAAPTAATGGAARDVSRGTMTAVDAEKVRQSAFLQASYGSEIKGVRVIRAPRAEAPAVTEAPSAPPPAPATARPAG